MYSIKNKIYFIFSPNSYKIKVYFKSFEVWHLEVKKCTLEQLI